MCPPFEAAIHQYVKGQLTGEDLRKLQLHFQVCGVCRYQVNQLRWRSMDGGTIADIAPQQPLPAPPEPKPDLLRQRMAERPAPQKRQMSLGRAVLIGVAVGVGLTMLLAPFVPSVFSVERSRSNIELRHMNGRVKEPSKPTARRQKKQADPAKPGEPMTMKLLTDDPDIVIHWMVE
jgi:hypothetical protein